MKCLFLSLLIVLSGCSLAIQSKSVKVDSSNFYGVATLKQQDEICLQMVSEDTEQPSAEIYVCYTPKDSEYNQIRQHIGPIEIGEFKEFEPFESSVKPNKSL